MRSLSLSLSLFKTFLQLFAFALGFYGGEFQITFVLLLLLVLPLLLLLLLLERNGKELSRGSRLS